jgi:succinate dehydrogenase / fumarate reductase flavoprotein subunit
MRSMMTSHVGIFRGESDLVFAREKVRELKERIRRVGLNRKTLAFNHELVHYLALEGMLHLAEVIVEGALGRRESRGSHFRLDYPARDDEHWLRHTMASKTKEGLKLNYKDVTITSHPPKERVY